MSVPPERKIIRKIDIIKKDSQASFTRTENMHFLVIEILTLSLIRNPVTCGLMIPGIVPIVFDIPMRIAAYYKYSMVEV